MGVIIAPMQLTKPDNELAELRKLSPTHHLLIVILYVLLGKAALMLALPPGYASAIFPPAGMAVALTFIFGAQPLPGIFIGSLLLNGWIASPASSETLPILLPTLAIAGFSTLQAAAGGWLLKRVLGYPVTFDHLAQLFRLLLISPVICLIGSSLSVTVLYLAGIVPKESFGENWCAWWIGDTLGIVLMLPLIMIVAGEPRMLWWSRRITVAVPMLLAFSFFVTVFVKVNTWEQTTSLSEFHKASRDALDELRLKLEQERTLLLGLQSLFAEAPAPQVTLQEFMAYTQEILSNFPSLQILEWAPRVPLEDRKNFEQTQQKVFPGFTIHELDSTGKILRAGTRTDYYPITYINPLAGNEIALGLDMSAASGRSNALKQALQTSLPVVTAPIRLVQAPRIQTGLLVFQSVSEAGSTKGAVLIVLKMRDFINAALHPSQQELYLRLFDEDARDALYDNFPRNASTNTFSQHFSFGTRHYRMETIPTPGYLARHRNWQSWGVLAMGTFGTGVLGALLLLGTGYAARVAAQVELKTAELRKSESRFQHLFEKHASPMLLINPENALIVSANDAAVHFYGYSPAQLCGLTVARINLRTESALSGEDYVRKMEEGHYSVFVHELANGDVRNVEIHSSPVEVDGKTLLFCVVHDITERKHLEEQMHDLAFYDPLTELPNRRLFYDRLDQAIRHSARTGSPVALLFVDLDHFKEVNDTLGHFKGDRLLQEAARRISQCVRASDTVARFGGDEFTIILPEFGHKLYLERIARELIDRLSASFILTEGEEPAFISASVGIALYPEEAASPEELMKHADQAMYAAKLAGKKRFHYFTKPMQKQAREKLKLTTDLRRVVAKGELEVYYQPIVDTFSRKVVKAEALLRWNHPEHGLVGPDRFIPLAEETGLIREIGEWVFCDVISRLKKWRRDFGLVVPVSVNMSPIEFEEGASMAWIHDFVNAGLPPHCINVEITEGLLLKDSPHVKQTLLEFRNNGIEVSIDDFGTGFSALSYLRQFDIDYLKIDQAFVRNLSVADDSQILTEAIIALAHKLGIKTIAEGVETPAQQDYLMTFGCDYLQGYLYARPLQVRVFEQYLAS